MLTKRHGDAGDVIGFHVACIVVHLDMRQLGRLRRDRPRR